MTVRSRGLWLFAMLLLVGVSAFAAEPVMGWTAEKLDFDEEADLN